MAKIIVTHRSPDADAICAIWIIRNFLPGWNESRIEYVSAGDRLEGSFLKNEKNGIEIIEEDEVIHLDTGLGTFDHHQINSTEISATSLAWEYVKKENKNIAMQLSLSRHTKWRHREEALGRIVKLIVQIDHFKDALWPDPTSDRYDISVIGILDGLKYQKPSQDNYYVNFISKCLDALLHEFENRVWAEEEIKEKGIEFETQYGKALAIESINDSVIKLAQKDGFMIVVRKDPRKGYVRIKARPVLDKKKEIDFTDLHEKLKKRDSKADWFLHISKKMILNGSSKTSKMRASSLSLEQIIEIIKEK